MKKLLVLAGAIVFLAAACNQAQPDGVGTTHKPSTPSAKVDAAVNALNQNLDSQDAIYTQSDSDVVNSDQSVINSYNGVSNASKY
jgi:hypothetical protein